jgi:hypothetical protein
MNPLARKYYLLPDNTHGTDENRSSVWSLPNRLMGHVFDDGLRNGTASIALTV